MVTTAKRAARRCPRSSSSTTTMEVRTIIPIGREGHLDHAQRVDEQGVVVGPVLAGLAEAVEPVERGAVGGDQDAEDRDDDEAQAGPQERDGAAAFGHGERLCRCGG